jgi:GDPmannose 4,6-dehydratase
MVNTTQTPGKPKVLIIGSGGQDGSYLSERFIARGAEVLSVRRSFFPVVKPSLNFRSFEVPDFDDIQRLITSFNLQKLATFVNREKPDLIYHLAAHHAPSGTKLDTNRDAETMWLTTVGITAILLETIVKGDLPCRLIVAGSSQMYSPNDSDIFVNEHTPTSPQNYYASTKVFARELISRYNSISPGIGQMAILFNHDSPRRPQGFLSTDISTQFVNVLSGRTREISVRNPYARLDLCDARDVVSALVAMSEVAAEDFVIGSSRALSVIELITSVSNILGIKDIEVTYSRGLNLPELDTNFALIADIERANKVLNWYPARTIDETIIEMIETKLSDD